MQKQPRFADAITGMRRDPKRRSNEFMMGLADTVDHPLTKRILVDAGLWESCFRSHDPRAPGSEPRQRWPFDSAIYLEPTKPIMPAKMQAKDPKLAQAIRRAGVNPETEPSYIRAALVLPTGQFKRDVCIVITWGPEIMVTNMEVNPLSGETETDVWPEDEEEAQGTDLTRENREHSMRFFGRSVINLMGHIESRGLTTEAEPETENRAERRRRERGEGQAPKTWYTMGNPE